MEKECEICGVFFETQNKNRKYCDVCRYHPDQKKKRMEKAYAESKRRMTGVIPPPEFKGICSWCGEVFFHPQHARYNLGSYESHDGKEHVFCSKKCKYNYIKHYAVCKFCGKSLADSDSYDPSKPYTKFCSKDCKEKYKIKIAKENGTFHICENCGNPFIRGDGTFCSKKCYSDAIKNGWKPARTQTGKPEKTPVMITRIEQCFVCGKKRTRQYTQQQIEENRNGPFCLCSEKCKQAYPAVLARRKKIVGDKEKLMHSSMPNTKKQAAKKHKAAEMDLCATCKVPYVDCVRMQTEFRVLPKGAHYNNHGRLVICPDFR